MGISLSYVSDLVTSITEYFLISSGPNNENCISKEELKKVVEKIGIKTNTSNAIQDAVKYITNKDKNSIIFIVGSIFLIGEVLSLN